MLARRPAAGNRLTATPRDEFSPAVSPDGKWFALVSNHLGNIDLFLMPIGGGEKQHIRIPRAHSGAVHALVDGQPAEGERYV